MGARQEALEVKRQQTEGEGVLGRKEGAHLTQADRARRGRKEKREAYLS